VKDKTSNSVVAHSGAEHEIAGHGRDARGLLLVSLFKMSKALFFGAMAAGALHMVHRDFGEMVMRVVNKLPVDPEGRLVSLIMNKADLVDSHHLREAGIYSFAYACVCVVEGIGLMKQKEWAEYFTIVLTAGALPWEVFEMIKHFSWFKVGLMVLNVVVLVYLLWLVMRMRKSRRQTVEGRQ
jgi:uncharacterized membrane protein (DUF2068 family)